MGGLGDSRRHRGDFRCLLGVVRPPLLRPMTTTLCGQWTAETFFLSLKVGFSRSHRRRDQTHCGLPFSIHSCVLPMGSRYLAQLYGSRCCSSDLSISLKTARSALSIDRPSTALSMPTPKYTIWRMASPSCSR